tara:strand:- start:860 stop:1015 length:156 start_codon:yes stop_codon:yes gene_type:complete
VPASQVQAEIITTEEKAGRYFWLEAAVAISSGEWVIFSWISSSDASYGSIP